MDKNEVVDYCLDSLKKRGVDKSTCCLTVSEKKELNVENDAMALLRTTFNTSLGISAIKNHKKASTSINKTDKNSIDEAVDTVIELTKGSKPDDAYDISDKQPKRLFSKGCDSADLDIMYRSLDEFVDYVKSTYPQVKLEAAIVDFNHINSIYKNTNGVDFQISDGIYSFSPVFLSKEGDKTTSFNYTGFSTLKIEKPLYKYAMVDSLLRESVEQLNTRSLDEKFVGKLIVTPDCIETFLGFIINDISDGKMITGNSIYKDKLNELITNPKLTLYSKPVSDEIEDGYFLTDDGYMAENSTILDKGILKTHLLGIYGANKLGKKRAVNDGGAYVIGSGSKSYSDLIKDTEKGILLSRFSGGNPSNNGDFSGVAKNSYFIENGKIKYPITETMVSGNIKDMFENLDDISNERVNYGHGILPWISFKGITIS